MTKTSDGSLQAVQLLSSAPVLAAFILGSLPLLLPMLACRLLAGRSAQA